VLWNLFSFHCFTRLSMSCYPTAPFIQTSIFCTLLERKTTPLTNRILNHSVQISLIMTILYTDMRFKCRMRCWWQTNWNGSTVLCKARPDFAVNYRSGTFLEGGGGVKDTVLNILEDT
jgi:hypothetical protein